MDRITLVPHFCVWTQPSFFDNANRWSYFNCDFPTHTDSCLKPDAHTVPYSDADTLPS